MKQDVGFFQHHEGPNLGKTCVSQLQPTPFKLPPRCDGLTTKSFHKDILPWQNYDKQAQGIG